MARKPMEFKAFSKGTTRDVVIIRPDDSIYPNSLQKAYQYDAGFDLCSAEPTTIVLNPGKWASFCTGLRLYLPKSIEAQIRPRSGLALNKGVTVLNAPGTIDPGYCGEIKVILINHSDQPVFISKLDKIAQIVFNKIENPSLYNYYCLSEDTQTSLVEERLDIRGENGFGSSDNQ